MDTLFLVLRKKKVGFLHWYHHITVSLFCWHAYVTQSNGLIFVAMNYSVHAVMYFYYLLTALGYKPFWAFFVTIIQISQMVVGTTVCLYGMLMKFNSHGCSVTDTNHLAGVTIYVSYFLLFMRFFMMRFYPGAYAKLLSLFGLSPKPKAIKPKAE